MVTEESGDVHNARTEYFFSAATIGLKMKTILIVMNSEHLQIKKKLQRIVKLRRKKPEKLRYIIHHLALRWNDMGYKVIMHYGTRNLPEADIVFLHVNKTIVPDAYANAVSTYPVVLNRYVSDISRRNYSTISLTRDDDFVGEVIVKTNKNYGGMPESRDRSRFARVSESWDDREFLHPMDYAIFNNVKAVPQGVWINKNLIVEKFLPEKEGDLHFIRYWTFFGDKSLSGRFGSRNPIVKFGNMETSDESVPIPEELIQLRKKFNIDYGRFDYVVHAGKSIVLDINKTQASGKSMDRFKADLDLLATGIKYYD